MTRESVVVGGCRWLSVVVGGCRGERRPETGGIYTNRSDKPSPSGSRCRCAHKSDRYTPTRFLISSRYIYRWWLCTSTESSGFHELL